MILLQLIAVLLIVAGNAFFVAAEYALVTVRRTRMHELAEQGHRPARLVLRLTEAPPRFIAAMQLGVTVASLGIGDTSVSVSGAIAMHGPRTGVPCSGCMLSPSARLVQRCPWYSGCTPHIPARR